MLSLLHPSSLSFLLLHLHHFQTRIVPTPFISFWIYKVWLRTDMAACVPSGSEGQSVSQLGRQWPLASPTHCDGVQLHFLHARWASVETENGLWLTATFSTPPPHHSPSTTQPCGQLTGRLGPYANFMMAETVIFCNVYKWYVAPHCT